MLDLTSEPLSRLTVAPATWQRKDELELDGRGFFIESRRIDRLIEVSRQRIPHLSSRLPWPKIEPAPQLVVTHPDFDAEAFLTNGNLFYVSRSLSESLAFSDAEVQYLPVDDSLSLPVIRKKGFRIIRFILYEDAADPERSKKIRWDEFMPGLPPEELDRLPVNYDEVVLKKDFQPSGGVFWILNVPQGPFITAETARRIAGLPDIEVHPAPEIRHP